MKWLVIISDCLGHQTTKRFNTKLEAIKYADTINCLTVKVVYEWYE